MCAHISGAAAVTNLGHLAFRRAFRHWELDEYKSLLECVSLLTPSLDLHSVSWCLEVNKRFSTRSLYRAMAKSLGLEPLTQLWVVKQTLKIRIFLWLWIHGCIAYGVAVRKCNGPGDCLCHLCEVTEDSNHIMFSCVTT